MTREQLAILGGDPAVPADAGPFVWPPIDADTEAAVLRQLQEGISIYDRSGVVADLEQALAGYHGRSHAVLTSSGTAALHSMYVACGIRADDEVIVPAYTFFATVTPLLHVGARPVLADCDALGNLDPLDAERRITERTRAIVVTHMWGMPADMASLKTIAEDHNLLLIEDGSHAHGATTDDQRVGTFGHAAAFSMNGPKPLSAGEGGFFLTDDDETYYRFLLHGQYNKRCRNEIPSNHELRPYATTGMGLKLRVHPLAAAIALQQLGRLDEHLAGRQAVARQMCEALGRLPGIVAPVPPAGVKPSWYGLALRYRSAELDGLDIDQLYAALQAEGCRELDRPGSTCPLNLHPLFQDPGKVLPDYRPQLAYRPGDFPVAESLHRNTLKLPVWHRSEDLALVDHYVEAFTKVTTGAAKLRRHASVRRGQEGGK